MENEEQGPASVQACGESVEELGIVISAGNLAKQAGGAVTIQLGETVVFVAVTAAAEADGGKDYFPLSVEYREKFCAAGRFPGGYVKREGRPSEKEVLAARLCDRPLRPLFPDGFLNEVQVVGMLLAADLQNEPDVLLVNGASAALLCSDIPWNGPIGCVRIGEVEGNLVVNPSNGQLYESNLDLLYVGNGQDMLMVEGSADQISEKRFLEALELAQRSIQPLLAAQRRLAEKVGRAKRPFPLAGLCPGALSLCRERFAAAIGEAFSNGDKREQEWRLAELGAEFLALAEVRAKEEGKVCDKNSLRRVFDAVQREIYRKRILENGLRSDGRPWDGIRPIVCRTGFLPRVHGVSLFQRGETQALVSTTLGTSRDAQSLDGITGGVNEKSFILHYNFPPFSVGETGRFGNAGRREIGHGALAERSLLPIIPDAEAFPYSLRLVSEVLESNGSSSMATVCGGTLALMDAGVPILAPVAGISVGLVTETDASGAIGKYALLTDILGSEDHFGDMDFKIAGTAEGITGFQLDLKIPGLPLSLVRETVVRSGEARRKILQIMEEELPNSRPKLRTHAPRMKTTHIPPDKIGALIGPGGKNIRRICDSTGAQINVDEDNSGKVMIFASSQEALDAALREVEMLSCEIEVGKTYRGVVRGIKEFGAFVECLPGKEGLVHISELDSGRVERTEDVCRVGDEMIVRCVGVDDKGRVKLSRRAAICDARGVAYEPHAGGRERSDGGGGGGGGRRDFGRDDDRRRPFFPDRGGGGGGGRRPGGGGGGRPDFRGRDRGDRERY
ncbi:MAG: polyribonucleotide nucleotidyltransferase [Puniceicoccales bacterium]|jgi:polyribonucleotide nucleotidyltransferase|nr:polyribonucleotide nucleotidyltransferase [Puniceicoccales bacterium]